MLDKNLIEEARNVCLNKDIKETMSLYNIYKYWKDSTPISPKDNKEWPRICFALCEEELIRRGVSLVFDDGVFEHPEAPGLIVRRNSSTQQFEFVKNPYDLEEILNKNEEIKELVKDDKFAQELYAAFCNVSWLKNNIKWHCSWRHAAGLVADLRNKGEDYLDYYCSGIGDGETTHEGIVTDRIREFLFKLGWTPNEFDIRRNLGENIL